MRHNSYHGGIPNNETLWGGDFPATHADPVLPVVCAHTTFHTYSYLSKRIITATLIAHTSKHIHPIPTPWRKAIHSSTSLTNHINHPRNFHQLCSTHVC